MLDVREFVEAYDELENPDTPGLLGTSEISETDALREVLSFWRGKCAKEIRMR